MVNMNKNSLNERNSFFLLRNVLFFILIFPLFHPHLLAEENSLQGPSFYKPDERMAIVRPEWKKQKIKYSTKYKDADVVAVLDQHLYPLVDKLIEKFAEEENLKIVIFKGTCGISAGMLNRKEVDIGGFCCPPAPTDRLPGLVFDTIGITPNAVIVNNANPITNMSFRDVQKIFAGEINRWDELSSIDAKSFKKPISVITRLHCKLRAGHWRRILDNENLFSLTRQEVASIPDMLARVAALRGSIGFVARWKLDYNGWGEKVKSLQIDGISPKDKNALAEGRYPFYKVLNLARWTGIAENPYTEKLISYIKKNLTEDKKLKYLVTYDKLQKNGWRFYGDELIGEPKK
ncbi:MAG: hypothetical protein D6734_11140 [Candidatus Schekmanbacteria bacterium]|nr:MAG: hypothetical protein D6734_11140 [Candidatus Schekmanbacteria bacterium]